MIQNEQRIKELNEKIQQNLNNQAVSKRQDSGRTYFYIDTIREQDAYLIDELKQANRSLYIRCWKIGDFYKIYVSDGLQSGQQTTKPERSQEQQEQPPQQTIKQPETKPEQAELKQDVKTFLKYLESKEFDLSEDKAEQLLTAIKTKSNIILIGETATGKTTLIKHTAEYLNKKTTEINCNPYMESEDIKGKYIAKPNADNSGLNICWIKSQIHNALEQDNFIVFEEINFLNPTLYSSLYELGDFRKSLTLTEKEGEIIHNPNAIIISTLNNGYAGTFDLWNNPAFLRRNGNAIIKMDYITPERESKLISKKIGISYDTLLNITKAIAHLRKERQEGNSDIIDIGIDRTEHIARFIKAGTSLKNAVEMGLINYIAKDTATAQAIREKISLFIEGI